MTTPNEGLKLLSCPFCGGDKIAGPYKDERERLFYVSCISRPGTSCASMFGVTQAEAVAAWNRRTDSRPPSVGREVVARIIDPDSWATHDHRLTLPDPVMTHVYPVLKPSLTKADAILALSPTPTQEGERLKSAESFMSDTSLQLIQARDVLPCDEARAMEARNIINGVLAEIRAHFSRFPPGDEGLGSLPPNLRNAPGQAGRVSAPPAPPTGCDLEGGE
jgi:hypothetical protein